MFFRTYVSHHSYPGEEERKYERVKIVNERSSVKKSVIKLTVLVQVRDNEWMKWIWNKIKANVMLQAILKFCLSYIGLSKDEGEWVYVSCNRNYFDA